jgi:hypothetical protein
MVSGSNQSADSGDFSSYSNRKSRWSRVMQRGVIFALVLGLLLAFGGTWYLRTRTSNSLNHQISIQKDELSGLRSDLDYAGECTNPNGDYF